jgi:hypothetical protein
MQRHFDVGNSTGSLFFEAPRCMYFFHDLTEDFGGRRNARGRNGGRFIPSEFAETVKYSTTIPQSAIPFDAFLTACSNLQSQRIPHDSDQDTSSGSTLSSVCGFLIAV